MRSAKTLFFFGLLALTTLGLSQSALASAFYFESQIGVTQVRQPSPFFGADLPASSELGPAINFSLAFSFSGGDLPVEFQLGLHHRVAMGSTPSLNKYYGTQASYPFLRIQYSKIYVGIGITPFVWKLDSPSWSLSNFSRSSNALSYLGEAGFLWAVTPDFTLGVNAAVETISVGGTLSPKPSAELTGLMRFYFGFSSNHNSGTRSSNEFKGWRYYMGNEMRDH